MLKIEKTHFYIYFFNMDLSLIMNITGTKIDTHVAETCLERGMFQKFDIGLQQVYMPSPNCQTRFISALACV